MEKDANQISKTPLNHLHGYKKILINNNETESNITQVALGFLDKGDFVEEHSHPSMEEYFYIINGVGVIYINNEKFEISSDKLFVVLSGYKHSIKALSQIRFLYWGVKM